MGFSEVFRVKICKNLFIHLIFGCQQKRAKAAVAAVHAAWLDFPSAGVAGMGF